MAEIQKVQNADYYGMLYEKSEDKCVSIEGGMYEYQAIIRNSYWADEVFLQIVCNLPDSEYAQVFARVTLNAQNEYEHPVVGFDLPNNNTTYNDFNQTKDIERLVHEIFTEYTIPKIVNKIFWNVQAHQVLCELVPSEISELIVSM